MLFQSLGKDFRKLSLADLRGVAGMAIMVIQPFIGYCHMKFMDLKST
jgi:hypothetical protein